MIHKNFLKNYETSHYLLIKDVPFELNEKCLSAFHRLKKALIYALIMQALDWGLPFKVMCDALDYVMGAI